MKTYTIGSSHGNAVISAKTGDIVSIDESLHNECNISKFNVDELHEFRKKVGFNTCSPYLDILSIGYWDASGKYTPPEAEYRTAEQSDKELPMWQEIEITVKMTLSADAHLSTEKLREICLELVHVNMLSDPTCNDHFRYANCSLLSLKEEREIYETE